MKHTLVVLQQAQNDIDQIYFWLSNRSPQGAANWYRAFMAATDGILANPFAFGVSSEGAWMKVDFRERTFKTRYGGSYRILYLVVDAQVRVVTIRSPGLPAIEDFELEP